MKITIYLQYPTMMSIYVSLGERQGLLIFHSMVKKRNIGKNSFLSGNPETLVADINITSYPSVQFSSVAQSYLTFCNPMNRSTPGLPVHHQLPESTQIRVHRVSDSIQTSHPLLAPSPPACNPSQH